MKDAKKYLVGFLVGILVTSAIGWAVVGSSAGQGFIFTKMSPVTEFIQKTDSRINESAQKVDYRTKLSPLNNFNLSK